MTRPQAIHISDPADPTQLAAARRWALELDLPLADADSAPSESPVLRVTEFGLELLSEMGRLRVDFLAGREALRALRGAGSREPLSRALGLRAKQPIRKVLDATAGLGRDSFLLACLGADVCAVERDPVVGALLQDGLERGLAHPDVQDIVRAVRLLRGDALDILTRLSPDEAPEAVYIDPMFPIRRKSALVKKEMRMVADLAGGPARDSDITALHEQACAVATRRVVMKRPTGAPQLQGMRPAHQSTDGGRTTRYDIWLTA